VVNHGDAWSRLHLAARFRPGEVPAAFAESVAMALAPPGRPVVRGVDDDCRRRLVVVVDMTYSMRPQLPAALDLLRELDTDVISESRAVLYSDHGPSDPLVVRDLGPCADIEALAAQIALEPHGPGYDVPEALEDAMRRCRELADALGPLTVLVLTDAPPHPPSKCPHEIDFVAEVGALLAQGSRCLVADDWLEDGDATWEPFSATAGFSRASLSEHVTALREPV
jgi:hypothetical protein